MILHKVHEFSDVPILYAAEERILSRESRKVEGRNKRIKLPVHLIRLEDILKVIRLIERRVVVHDLIKISEKVLRDIAVIVHFRVDNDNIRNLTGNQVIIEPRSARAVIVVSVILRIISHDNTICIARLIELNDLTSDVIIQNRRRHRNNSLLHDLIIRNTRKTRNNIRLTVAVPTGSDKLIRADNRHIIHGTRINVRIYEIEHLSLSPRFQIIPENRIFIPGVQIIPRTIHHTVHIADRNRSSKLIPQLPVRRVNLIILSLGLLPISTYLRVNLTAKHKQPVDVKIITLRKPQIHVHKLPVLKHLNGIPRRQNDVSVRRNLHITRVKRRPIIIPVVIPLLRLVTDNRRLLIILPGILPEHIRLLILIIRIIILINKRPYRPILSKRHSLHIHRRCVTILEVKISLPQNRPVRADLKQKLPLPTFISPLTALSKYLPSGRIKILHIETIRLSILIRQLNTLLPEHISKLNLVLIASARRYQNHNRSKRKRTCHYPEFIHIILH